MDMFSALAEPTRRNIIEALANNGQLSASDIYGRFKVSHPAISQHLKVLRETNLVRMEKHAQQRLYKLNTESMLEVERWAKQMVQIWDRRFDALDDVLEEEKARLLKTQNKKGNKHGSKTE